MIISREEITDLPVAAAGYKLIKQDGTSIYNGYNYALDGEVEGTIHKETLYEDKIHGFYFCPELIDCYRIYSLSPEYLIVKVRAYGKIDKNEGNKAIRAEIIEIVDTLTFEEGLDIITQEKDVFDSIAIVDSRCIIDSKSVVDSSIVHKSTGVHNSSVVDNSCAIYDSDNIFDCYGVYQSWDVKGSVAIEVCNNIFFSQATADSENIRGSAGVIQGWNVKTSLSVQNSSYINRSRAIVGSSFVDNSQGISESTFILNAAALDKCCFCTEIKGLVYGFCNKEIPKKTWETINKYVCLFINKTEKKPEDFENLIDKLSQYEGYNEKMVRALGEQLLCDYC